MSVKLKTASNGSVTLAPEDTASDVTLTVPAGTSSLVSNTTLRTELNATGSAPIFACRAWCNFDGTIATPSTIRASGNVSSVTKNGTGDFTINFTTAMPDADYSVAGTVQQLDLLGIARVLVAPFTSAPTTTASRIAAANSASGALFNAAFVSVAFFR